MPVGAAAAAAAAGVARTVPARSKPGMGPARVLGSGHRSSPFVNVVDFTAMRYWVGVGLGVGWLVSLREWSAILWMMVGVV
jgi:hypothetical protein